MSTDLGKCLICGAPASPAGEKLGVRTGHLFRLRRCTRCDFGFVENPWTDYATIYDEAYYAGRGSDPMVDYASEYENSGRNIRQYEWRGIQQAVATLAPRAQRWLDYGCGNGAFVRHLVQTGLYQVSGFDSGAWAERARADQLPILRESELPQYAGTFDVITAIEVIEHVTDPVAFLREIRRLARPGAVLFLTTQNISNAPRRFVDWPYIIPEIHVSFFSPTAMALALEQSGFEPHYAGFTPGWDQIMRFKILKNLGFQKTHWWEKLVPWPLVARLVDRSFKFTVFPVGIAR